MINYYEQTDVDKESDSLERRRSRGALLFVSVLLHSLLALFPWRETSRPSIVSPAPPSPVTVVDASLLPTLPTPEPQRLPAPTVAVSPPVPPPVIIQVDPPANLPPNDPGYEISDRLIDGPASQNAPNPTNILPESTSSKPQTPPSLETHNVTPNNEAQITADWENLVGHLQNQNDGFKSLNLSEIFTLFGEPGQINQFFYENNQGENTQPKFDLLSYHLFSEQTPEEVLQTVVIPKLTNSPSFDLQPQVDFPAGLAYPLLQGEQLRYLIIVKLNEGSGSVLILSESLPD